MKKKSLVVVTDGRIARMLEGDEAGLHEAEAVVAPGAGLASSLESAGDEDAARHYTRVECCSDPGAVDFAQAIAARLQRSAAASSLGEVTVFSPPEFYRLLSAELGPQVTGHVSSVLYEDLVAERPEVIRAHVPG